MLLTGYHGTNKESLNNILTSNNFYVTNGEKEWLGKGIYFYPNFEDALKWAVDKFNGEEAVVHGVISIGEDEILDLDCSDGERFVENIKLLCEPCFKTNAEENQCILSNMIWEMFPKIKVLKSKFATKPNNVRLLKNYSPKRIEFCVRNNDVIIGISEIKLSNVIISKIKDY